MDPSSFINSYDQQPSIHLVFKSAEHLKKFEEPHARSSSKSAFLIVKKKISEIKSFKDGNWWVQDFSSMVPLEINNKINNKNILDMCVRHLGVKHFNYY